MSPFEYIIVLISIILGMGITEILSSVGSVILRWENVKLYWPHTLLVLLVFIFHFQEWWVIYELRTFEQWRLPVFLFTILYPVNLYILARILFPFKWGDLTDLKTFYFENCRKIFLFVLTLAIISIIDNLFLVRISFADQIPQILLAIIAASLIFSGTKNEKIHKAVILLLMTATIIAFAVEWDVLLIQDK